MSAFGVRADSEIKTTRAEFGKMTPLRDYSATL